MTIRETGAIAIIGIGCRFPGAAGPRAFWRLMCDGVDAIREIPPDRPGLLSFYDPRMGIPGTLYSRWGGFLDDIDRFDSFFFGLSPREAERMDPQQRLLLEVAWEALEDAGQVLDRLRGEPVGVYVGNCSVDYEDIVDEDLASVDIHFGSGTARSVLSGRISHALGLQGPSLTIDTACSSSLVAVHLACQSLRVGESTLAVAGGVNLVLNAKPSLAFSQARMLAPDGRCKAFDASGDGFVRSDGAGLVVLKPLERAIEDGDPVYAVIRGSAVNNDGQSGGLLMTPSRPGQEAAIRSAYRNAGILPGRVQYVEAHGTGTSVGDPIEAQALGAVLAEGRRPGDRCRIGSVKTNIGHTEGAAGVAGLIKVALSLKHQRIPPSLHLREPNPAIAWDSLPLVVQTELTPWPERSEPRIAGISAFGISGTNVHMVVEGMPTSPRPPAVESRSCLLTVSAHSPEGLAAMALAYEVQLAGLERDHDSSLEDICYTAGARRTQHDYRLAVAAASPVDMAEKLAAFRMGELRADVSTGRRAPDRDCRIVFVYPGQGSQWPGMTRDLLREEALFRKTLEDCDAAMRPFVEWSLLDEICASEADSRLNEVDVVQPALFGVQVALTALWRSWGIEPDWVIGHSMGEVAAAHTAGILDLEDAAKVICLRSRIVRQRASGRGGMAVVGMPAEPVRALLSAYGESLTIAAWNGPATTVIAGDPGALEEVQARVEREGSFFQRVRVDYASHSLQMEPLIEELVVALAGLRPRPATRAMVSTVTGERLDGPECDARYWARNLRQPVRFAQGVDRLGADGATAFLEMSGHPILAAAIGECLNGSQRAALVLPSMRRGEPARQTMLGSLGALHVQGTVVEWPRLLGARGRSVSLPSYPWQKERFWLEVRSRGGVGQRSVDGRAVHPLLGHRQGSALARGAHVWQARLPFHLAPELLDHRVQGTAVVPATAYVEMALAAAAEALGEGAVTVEDMRIEKALFLSEEDDRRLELVLTRPVGDRASFEIFASGLERGGTPTDWTRQVSGTVRLRDDTTRLPPESPSIETIRERCGRLLPARSLYEMAADRGLQYGPAFQGVEQIWCGEGESLGRIHLDPGAALESERYVVPPALLDACLQASAPLVSQGLFVPVAIERVRVHHRPSPACWSHAILVQPETTDGAGPVVDVLVIDDDGSVAVEVRGLAMRRLEPTLPGVGQGPSPDALHEVCWVAMESTEARVPASRGAWLILADTLGVAARLRAGLEARGEHCVMAVPGDGLGGDTGSSWVVDPRRPESFRALLEHAFGADAPPARGVIHAWSIDAPPGEPASLEHLHRLEDIGCVTALHLVQALAEYPGAAPPRLWLLTRGVHLVDGEQAGGLSSAPLWGLGKSIALEHPELRCTRVDLSALDPRRDVDALLAELFAEDTEAEISLRGPARMVPRVRRWSPPPDASRRLARPGEDAFRLEVPNIGILDDFMLRAVERRPPGRNEVEILVRAAGLNFRDVVVAMGLIPPAGNFGFVFGWECAGQVVAVGEGVERFEVGDEVVGMGAGCLGSYLTTGATFVARRPTDLTPEDAATIPITFITAHYALNHLARLQRGERILIHAAAGGVGLAAVQLARRAGAEIFATAGSPEKRDFLRSLGIEHVMDSRSLAFAREILSHTGGEGVDVVLNSLSGEFIARGLEILRGGGRFLELGKVDVLADTPLGLRSLDGNRAFFAVDLAALLVTNPQLIERLLGEVMEAVTAGELTALPARVFPVTDAVSAFRHLGQGKNIGKVVVSLSTPEVPIVPRPEPTVRADGTYLITGGLGGLGLQVARRLVEQGARHLVLVSRRGLAAADAPAAEAKEALEALRETGANIVVMQADVSRPGEVARLLDEIRHGMPPLRGLVHAAAVLDDGILLHHDRDRLRRVFAPKVDAAWNLHAATEATPLDFFVLFSSAASVLGSPGQGSYVAANAFLDALAHYRRARGLPAVSINWGAWGEVGQAARADRAASLAGRGVLPMSSAEALQLFDYILRWRPAQVMAARGDWSRLHSLLASPLLSELVTGAASEAGHQSAAPRELLMAEPAERWPALLQELIVIEISRVLRCAPAKIDVQQPLTRLGLDSLMAVELRNRLEGVLHVRVPVTELLKGPTIAVLAAGLAAELAQSVPPPAAIPSRPEPEALLARLDELSDDEVEALLRVHAVETPPHHREQ